MNGQTWIERLQDALGDGEVTVDEIDGRSVAHHLGVPTDVEIETERLLLRFVTREVIDHSDAAVVRVGDVALPCHYHAESGTLEPAIARRVWIEGSDAVHELRLWLDLRGFRREDEPTALLTVRDGRDGRMIEVWREHVRTAAVTDPAAAADLLRAIVSTWYAL